MMRWMNRGCAGAALMAAMWAAPVMGQTAGMVSFQGLIKDAKGDPITGTVDLEFQIYDAQTLGNLVDMDGDGVVEDICGEDVTCVSGVVVTDGILSTKFGPVSPRAFDGNPRWLEVSVDGTPLSRIEIATAPATAEQVNIPATGVSAIHVDATGSVGIGTPTPGAKLDIAGTIKIVDGTQGAGKILTSDANGAASWQAPGAQAISGSFYRLAVFSSYSQSSGWMGDNNASLFGGVNPSTWGDGNGVASQLSADKDVLRTLFTRKGYAGNNAMVYANEWVSYSSTNSRHAAALFRIRNNTGGDIVWTVTGHHTAYGGWSERASVALNGVSIWDSGGSTLGGASPPIIHNLTIPANRTSTAIFISASSSVQGTPGTRTCFLAFSNNSLALPPGLEYVDDFDTASGGWEQ